MNESQLTQNDLDIVFDWIARAMQGGPVTATFQINHKNYLYIQEFSMYFLKELKTVLEASHRSINEKEYSKAFIFFQNQCTFTSETTSVIIEMVLCNEDGPLKNNKLVILVEKCLVKGEDTFNKENYLFKLYK